MQKVQAILNKYLAKAHTIIVGCSGGPDSMFLVHALLEYRLHHPINIVIAHVDHHIRATSQRDLFFVKDFCQSNDLLLETTTLNEIKHTEAHLRTKRYEFFQELITKYQADMLLTAHHADDLMETILMRLTRGSNLRGYSGFPILNTNGAYPIFRPLINLTKEQIINYNQTNNIKYVLDETNTLPNYTRNRYREQILPFLKKENPLVHQKFLEFSEELIKVQNVIDKIVDEYLAKYCHHQVLDLTNLSQEDELISQKIIEKYLAILYPDNLYLITKKHLNLVLKLVANPTNSSLNLPNNLTLIKEYNLLKTSKLSTPKSYEMPLLDKQELPNGYIIEITQETEDTSNYTIRLNSAEITLPLIVRSKRPKDIMTIKNLNGHKKIQDILINSKVPKEARAIYPVLTDSQNTILWLPGLKKSKFDKSKQEKYDIIVKYYSFSTPKEKK